jgi:phosphate transport system ATP-binding protein
MMEQGGTPAKIAVKHLSVHYSGKPALSDVSLDIQKNEILAVFGPANSGTTTFLRSLNRLCETDRGAGVQGEVLLDGKNIYLPDAAVTDIRRRIGMVFEVPAPLPLSIFDNIAYGPRMNGLKAKGVLAQVVEEALSMAALWGEVKDRLHTPAFRLSGGQQQRLCIARVLAMKPEVILLDRSCSGLDPVSTAKVEESLRDLVKTFTIVIAPHNVQQAGRIADRVAFLLSGRVVEQGLTARVFTNPNDKRTSDYIEGRFG